MLDDGRVLVVGGCIGSGICSNRAELFDPATNTWTEAAPLSIDRSAHAAVLLDDGNVLIAGGGSIIDTTQDDQALLYNSSTNQWQMAGFMLQPRHNAEALHLSDGHVLVVGGGYRNVPQTFEIFASSEIYDPVLNSWSPAASLQEARYFFSMPPLQDGRALVVGGVRDPENFWTDQSFVSEIEIYDPVTDQWHVAGDLPDPTAHGTANLLVDGRVWVTGGYLGNYAAAYKNQTWLLTIE